MDEYLTSRRKRGSMRPLVGALIAAFVLGAALAGYGVYRYAGGERESAPPAIATSAPSQSASPTQASPTPASSATGDTSETRSTETSEAVERVAEQQGGIDQRLAAAEQRLSRLDIQAQAAAGNAARAEGLLIAFAARRALERGDDLGYLGDQLRLRFGDALPNAVRTVIEAGRDPVTMDELIARLEGLSPELAKGDRDFSWDRIRTELSQLFVVRRESTPSPLPQRRLDRARLFLESGRVEAAIAEVRNLPGANMAKNWIRDAERYAAAKRALDLIETAAVLEPRMLRDGKGNRIEQPSPAEQPAEGE